MPSVFAASAAVAGGMVVMFSSPSVSRTMILLFAFLSFIRFAALASAEPMDVPSSTRPMRRRSRFFSSQS